MNKDYRNYSADDFIADEFFQQWVQNPTGEQTLFWEEWLIDHPHKQPEVTQAINFLNNMRFQTAFPSEQEIEYALQKQLQLIEAIVDVGDHQSRKKMIPRIFAWTATAVFTGMLFFAGWYFWQPGVVTIDIVTGNGEIKRIPLPDSTTVTLNGNSKLRYTSNIHTAAIRDVWLNGEAFFEVKHINEKNEARRFIVHSGNLDVEVLGTTFNVKKRASVTNVTLNSGKIKIDLKDDPGSVIYLHPGDFIQYSDKDNHILKKQVKPELYSVWKEEKLQLDNMPLADLAQFIHDIYGLEIIIEDKLLADTKISGMLLFKNEEVLIETLSVVLNIDIIRKDSVLLFKQKTKSS